MNKEEKKAAIVAYFEDVPVYRYAAMHVGINEDTLILWRNEDSEFSERLDFAKTKWVSSKVKKAKVEFALERLEREVFAPPKQEHQIMGDPVKELLKAYGVTEGMEDATEIDESVQDSSSSQT